MWPHSCVSQITVGRKSLNRTNMSSESVSFAIRGKSYLVSMVTNPNNSSAQHARAPVGAIVFDNIAGALLSKNRVTKPSE